MWKTLARIKLKSLKSWAKKWAQITARRDLGVIRGTIQKFNQPWNMRITHHDVWNRRRRNRSHYKVNNLIIDGRMSFVYSGVAKGYIGPVYVTPVWGFQRSFCFCLMTLYNNNNLFAWYRVKRTITFSIALYNSIHGHTFWQ